MMKKDAINMEKITGVVNKVVYYDENKGFGIIKLKLDFKNKEMAEYRNVLFSNILTILSNFDRKPIVDEEYYFEGELETSNYGIQLRSKMYKRLNEDTKEGIITYLSSELFPTIGLVNATRIYDALGNNCLKLIIEDKKVLEKVKLTPKQKDIVYENLNKNFKNEEQLVELLNIGISMHMAIKIIKKIGENASMIVKENPYELMYLIEGIGFARADDIAMNVGITKDAPIRIKALIVFMLKNFLYNSGNTYMSLNDLYIEVMRRANEEKEVLNKDNYKTYIKELNDERKILVDDDKNAYTSQTYYDEYTIAKRIYAFLQNDSETFKDDDISKTLNIVMKHNNIEYSNKQIEAITKALKEPITIITGGPGTGKSTIIKGIVDTYSNLFKNSEIVSGQILLLAPTGRASKRLKELTKHEAMTIHKALGYDGSNHFRVTKEEPLEAKMIIIDEFSMVDASLAAYLFSCIKDETKIVIVGDADQLPSVGSGDVLLDLIESREISTIKLDKIHRQASDSTIIQLAHEINQGNLPNDLLQLKHDRNFIRCDDFNIIKIIEQTIENALNKGMDIIKDIQVLVPLYKGDIGIDSINYHLQDKFNPSEDGINYMGHRFRVNDKVIQLVNRSEKRVMNGDIGQILSITKENDKVKNVSVTFDFGVVDYEKEELEDLNLAYAISVHKAQGSEFPLVIVPFSFKYFIMLKRKLIYTTVTRAKKFLIMLGNYEAIRKGIVELEIKRQTKLTSRIKEIFIEPNKIVDLDSVFEKLEEEELENITPYDFL